MTNLTAQNKQTTIRFVEALGCNDKAAMLACLAPDAVNVTKGFSKLSGPRGVPEMDAFFGTFKELLPTGLRSKVHTVFAEADRVVIEWEGDARTAQGVPYVNQYCMVITLRDGKISLINEYLCTVHAEAVMWPLIEPLLGNNPPV